MLCFHSAVAEGLSESILESLMEIASYNFQRRNLSIGDKFWYGTC